MFIFSKLTRYIRKNGLQNTCIKCTKEFFSFFRTERFIFYYVDLPYSKFNINRDHTILSYCSLDIPADLLNELKDYFGAETFTKEASRNFAKNANLWILTVEGHVAGVLWTIVGTTIAKHFFQIYPKDVHFFSDEILKKYRGKGYNPDLINYVLHHYKEKNLIRAYLETSIKNIPQQKSLKKTPFMEHSTTKKYLAKRFFLRYLS